MDIKAEIRSLTIVHMAMVMGATLFFIIATFILNDDFELPMADFSDVLIYPAILFIFVAVFLSPLSDLALYRSSICNDILTDYESTFERKDVYADETESRGARGIV